MTSTDTLPEIPPEAAATQLLFRLGTGYMASAALQVALKLEIADRISSDPCRSAELAKADRRRRRCAVPRDPGARQPRALRGAAPRTFALTLAGGMLRKGPGSFYDMGCGSPARSTSASMRK